MDPNTRRLILFAAALGTVLATLIGAFSASSSIVMVPCDVSMITWVPAMVHSPKV